MICGALAVPTVCAAKIRLVGFSVTGRTPVPERSRIKGVALELFVNATLPLIEPDADGVKVTDMVHLALAGRAPLQGLLPLPTAAKSAEAVKATIFTLPTPVLVTVTVRAALVTPVS